ncbi:uncharacterized protein LOC133862904 isoform X1 [Alnus glutinosa]|uniref:uncharacterized protein LOC133862904 isoform X1 n=1 Tax=Alnus glutinosa TaxID=3517 RepID=UPI002D76C798|nr:uncharacterized protein LOC133862904 isoform X1 [Alnus glutinosa]
MFLPIGLRICCKELAKHSPSVGFTFGEIFVIHYKVASRRPKLEIHAARIIGSIQSLQVIWIVSYFMPCVWSQVSKKMSMKIPCNFQVKKIRSYAIVRTSL